MKKKLLSALLAVAVVASSVFGGAASVSAATQKEINQNFEKCGNFIYKTIKEPKFGSIGGEWVMYGFGISGYPMSKEYISSYQKSVEDAVKEGFRGTPGILHDRKYTEYSRVIVAYSAIGLDPTNIAGYDMVAKLADFDKVIWQGLNGPIWALRALDSGNYTIPKDASVKNPTTKQKLINHILNAQLKDGGWNLYVSDPEEADFEKNKSRLKADPDITGMTLSALAPYRNQTKVKKAIDKGVAALSKIQDSKGGFSTMGATTSESSAQVICGLTACGINPNADKRFVKNGKSAVDAIMTFYDEKSGGFRHVNTATTGYKPVVNQMATEQAYYALAEYKSRVPEGTAISKVAKVNKTTLKATWKKAVAKSACDGYQITTSTNANFNKDVKKATVKNRNTVSGKVNGLKKNKTYYVKVRTYKNVNGVKVYGTYSEAKKVKL